MSIKAPPVPLHTPNFKVLKRGTVLHRVHLTRFAGNAFNPCAGGQTRFAPIADAGGQCVPSLYAGSSLNSAIYETIFHDVPAKAAFKTVRRQDVHRRSHTELILQADLNMVSLRAVDLRKWRIKRQELIGSSAKLYGQTARWAEAIHHAFSRADGLVWTSNQCDPDSAYLFFGDRVKAGSFTITGMRDGLTDKSFQSDVRAAGQLGGITLTI